jgi:hypothetical protein
MAADGSSDKTGPATHPLLTQRRRPELLASTYLQVSLRKMRTVKKHTVAATLALLLFVVAAEAFLSREDRMLGARSVHESGNHNDATLLLAKATGMANSDEAKTLLEALEDGTLDYEDVSSALEEDASKKKAKMKAEVEGEANRKAAEEKAAAEKAAAEKAVIEKAATERAAADKASFKSRKADPQPRIDDFFDNSDDYDDVEDDWRGSDFEDEIADGVDGLAFPRKEHERSVRYSANQDGGRVPSRKESYRAASTKRRRQQIDRIGAWRLSDDVEEEEEDDDWLGGDFEDEITDGVHGLAFPRGEQKRSDSYRTSQGDRRAPLRKENGLVSSTNRWRARLHRKESPNNLEKMEKMKEEPERRNGVDVDYYGNNKQRGKSSPLPNQKLSHSLRAIHPKATMETRQYFDGGAKQQRGGWREGGGRR